MSRIRTVKPSFFTDARLYRLERDSGLPIRLAYVGLWTVADREGRFVVDVDELKAKLFPFDAVDFELILKALEKGGRIALYEVDGVSYGCVLKFTTHQFINGKEPASILPAPPNVKPIAEPSVAKPSIDVLEDESNASVTREEHVNDASPTREEHVNDAIESGSGTREEPEKDASRKERKGKEGSNNNNDARELFSSEAETVGPRWFELVEDRTVRLIAETAYRIPKFAPHCDEFVTRERVEKLVAELRSVAPAEEAITFELDNWETYNSNGKGQAGRSGGAKDAVQALRKWFKNDLSRWALAKKQRTGSGRTPPPSPRGDARSAAERRKAMFGSSEE
ncbi:hypothetical protein [Caudoviricetes sp.]|nr:hypothetical protein [Caudoviricetes sp.]